MKTNPLDQDFSMLRLLRFTMPSVIMLLSIAMYTAIDSIFVAYFVNTLALAAINIVFPTISIVLGIGTMLSTGGGAIIGQCLGRGERDLACRYFTFTLLIGICLGSCIAAFGYFYSYQLAKWLGADQALLPYCLDYLRLLVLFAPALILQILFQSFVIIAGRPTMGLVLSVGAGIINIILDYLFMGIAQMGIAGAALGTGLGYLFPSFVCLYFFRHCPSNLRFARCGFYGRFLYRSCTNGSSEMINEIASAVTTFCYNAITMRLLGADGVAAITIILYAQFLLTALYIGFASGAAPIVSFNYGARLLQRLRHIFALCLVFTLCSSIVIFAVSWYCGNLLISLFAPAGSSIYMLAAPGFRLFSFSFLFSGFNILVSSCFTALTNGKISALLSFMRTFGFILAALYLLPDFYGIYGVWLAVPIAEALSCAISLYCIYRYRREYLTPFFQ